jgi:hypothetical protein
LVCNQNIQQRCNGSRTGGSEEQYAEIVHPPPPPPPTARTPKHHKSKSFLSQKHLKTQQQCLTRNSKQSATSTLMYFLP